MIYLFIGQILDADQLALIDGRPAVEKALADVESIKLQLEDVAKEEIIKEVSNILNK